MTKDIYINDKGNAIPVSVNRYGNEHIIKVDGVEWVRTINQTHAAVLFNMIADHITEYVTYEI